MTQDNEAIRRALAALRPEDGDGHPGYEVLEAYVDGRLSAEQSAEIARLAEQSPIVAEDIADLQAVRRALSNAPAVTPAVENTRNVRWGRIAAIGAVAATLIIGIFIARPAPVDTPHTLLTADEAARVKAVLTDGRVTLPADVAAIRTTDGTLLGSDTGSRFSLVTPIGSSVLSARPQFTWTDAQAEAYTIAIFDQNFSEVARGRTTDTSWRPDVDLPRDATYSWQVTAHRGGEDETEPKPPRPEARFMVMSEDAARQIAEMQSRLSSDPLSLGILLAERGLVIEAREQFDRAAQRPETADTARLLSAALDQGTPITTKPAQ